MFFARLRLDHFRMMTLGIFDGLRDPDAMQARYPCHDRAAAMIHLSIVSHGHGPDVAKLLNDLGEHCREMRLSVILILNRDEELSFAGSDFPFPLIIRRNDHPRGFAENNNQAFRIASPAPDDYFCLINPDVRLPHDVFGLLVECLEREPGAGVVAPQVCNSRGEVEDNARRLPSPMAILRKALGMQENTPPISGDECQPVDWVAGMFMLFPASVYAAVGGFDERYFLYYEDVDLCCRLRLAGYEVFLAPSAVVVHDGRRDSHRRPAFFLRHLRSMGRFFLSPSYLRCRFKLRAGGGKKSHGRPV